MSADIPGAGLPAPTSVEGLYLAALLDEIRLLRQDLATARPADPPAGELELREPDASPVENIAAGKPVPSRGKKRS